MIERMSAEEYRRLVSAFVVPEQPPPRKTTPGFTVHLPPPPSVNMAFRNVPKKGRVATGDYKRWRNQAQQILETMVAKGSRVKGPFAVAINLPVKLKGDIDNRVKGVLDALVKSALVSDDRFLEELHVCRRAEQDFAVVVVRPYVEAA